jgi:hypothetical protein
MAEMDQTPVLVIVHLTVRDLYLANLWHLWRRVRWVGVLVGMVAAAGILMIVMSHGEQRKNLIQNFRPLFGLILFWLVAVFGGLYFSARSMMKQQKGLSHANRYTFSETGIEMQADKASGQMDWSYIFQAFETKRFFFLYLSKGMRHMIPKKFFTDANDVARLRTLIRTYVKGKVRLLT